jgi:SRSO17 transposase
MYKLVKTPSRLNPFLAAFSDLFTKPSYNSFRHMTSAIVVCAKSKTVSNLHDIMSNNHKDKKSSSSYNWFLNDAKWDADKVAQKKAELFFDAINLKEKDCLLLIIDDTYNEKKGKHTEGVGKFYDHSKGHIWGNNFVTSVLQSRGLFIPHKAKMYVKKDEADEEFRTKIQIAFEDIIKPLEIPDGVELMIVFDSWWFSSDLIIDCRELGYHVTCQLKSDKLVVPDDKAALQVTDYAKKFNAEDYKMAKIEVRGKKKRYLTIERIVKLDKIGDVKLVISKRKNDKDPKYYISTNTNLTDAEILSIYEDRWNIETAHREANQKLGFKDYQLRSKKAIERFIQLVFSIWTGLLLLELNNSEDNYKPKTIGEMVDEIRAEGIVEFVKNIMEYFNLPIPDGGLLYLIREMGIKT